MLPENVVPFAPPRNAALVNHQHLIATSEAVRVVEQAPSYEPAGDNRVSMVGSFRFAIFCVVDLIRTSQLLIATAIHIPVLPNTFFISKMLISFDGESSVKMAATFLPSMVLVELVQLIIYVDWPLHILRNLHKRAVSHPMKIYSN